MKTELQIFLKLKAKVQSLYNILKLHTFEKKLGRKLALPVIDYLTFALLKHEGQITTKKKLWETFELEKRILAIKIASADKDERQVFIPLNKDLYGLFVCDAGYVSQELEEKFRIEHQRRILIAPRKNMKKLATYLDLLIYNTRMTIEL